jgi:hypothetical protein
MRDDEHWITILPADSETGRTYDDVGRLLGGTPTDDGSTDTDARAHTWTFVPQRRADPSTEN